MSLSSKQETFHYQLLAIVMNFIVLRMEEQFMRVQNRHGHQHLGLGRVPDGH